MKFPLKPEYYKEFYSALYEMIQQDHTAFPKRIYGVGICHYLHTLLQEKYKIPYWDRVVMVYHHLPSYFPELDAHKPITKFVEHSSSYWFPKNEIGWAKRLDIIQQLINTQ
jgi:hypothetical protein